MNGNGTSDPTGTGSRRIPRLDMGAASPQVPRAASSVSGVLELEEDTGRPSVHQEPPQPPAGGSQPAPKPFVRTRTSVLAAAVLLVAAVGAGATYYRYAASHESTDDAFVEGRIVQVSPKVPGQVVRVHVTDNQEVKQGDLLVEVDSRDFESKLAQGRANLAAAHAQAVLAQADARRFEELLRQKGVSQQERDTAVAKSRTAMAQIAQLEAAVRQADLDLSYTKVVAPEAGRITKKSVEAGSYVQVGQALLAIVPRDFWVVANFKETQLTHMRPGQPVEITVDAYPGERFTGHVDSIQSGAGARFSLLPPENATGNYVKVVQRVPVKILFDQPPDAGHPLGPGMSVEPTVRVR